MFIFFKCPGNVGMPPQHAEKPQSNTWTLHPQILSMWDTCVNLHPARQPLKSFLNHFIRGPALFPLVHHASIYFWMNEEINIWNIYLSFSSIHRGFKHQVYSISKITYWKMTDQKMCSYWWISGEIQQWCTW